MQRCLPRGLAPVALALSLFCVPQAHAQTTPDHPFLHHLFSDNMVLQRDMRDPVWGWTDPNKAVSVRTDKDDGTRSQSVAVVSGADGRWMARIGPFKAGGPYTMTVTGPQTVTLTNVLVGDVWICSGQSNMSFGIGGAVNGQQEIADANYPEIRLYTVPNRISTEPQTDLNSKWDVCSPQTVGVGGWNGFTAVGYFFGRDLYQKLKIPIGLIHSSWGGTVAQAWTSAGALDTMTDFKPQVADFQKNVDLQKNGPQDFQTTMANWYSKIDPGSAVGASWADPAANTADWATMKLPGYWENSGVPALAAFDGVVWYRKEFDLPQDWQGKDLILHVGPVDDRDTTYVNGVRVGGLDGADLQRDYPVGNQLLKPGKNVISVRVLDTGGMGGIHGKPEDMRIEAPGVAGSQPISLAGDWQYKISAPLAQSGQPPVQIGQDPNQVTVLYNGMIAPLEPFAIKGAIWYQGESNAGNAMQYRTLLPTMIKDWRSHFGEGAFPFYIVQLANFMGVQNQPSEGGWADLREAQYLTTKTTRNTGVASAIDIGDAGDIHPKNKQEVGRRLALTAEALTYHLPVEYSGPEFKKMTVDGNRIRLTFNHLGGGLVAKADDNKLKGFGIAGADGKFSWADATIEGDTVVVSSPDVPNPTAVRYDWANNPIGNLYNKEGLPAVPFRTDVPPTPAGQFVP